MAGFDQQVVISGYFTGLPSAYIGFDLVENGNNYYGWIQVSNPLEALYGNVVDWACETTPNTPIMVGAVPEPSTYALLLAGGGIFALWSRRRPVLPRDTNSMRAIQISPVKRMRALLLALICLAAARESRAQSSFAGVLLATNGSGIVAGAVQLSVNGGQVSFQSTQFQAWVTNTRFAPTLEVQGDKISFDLGTGTEGSWPVGQFTGPFPGQSMAPAPNQPFPNLEQMPGLQPLSPGARFAGVFTAFPALENALLTSGGKISLRVNGTVDGMENPLAVEALVTTSPRIANQFAATLTAANEIPPHASPYGGNGLLVVGAGAGSPLRGA